MELQKTFKESYMKTLRDAVNSEITIPIYGKETFEIDTTQVKRLANVYAPVGLAEKLNEVYEDDFKSAVAIFEAYEKISPLLASNEAFWAYLTHVDLFSYAQNRWPKVKEKNCGSEYILDHWFISGNGPLRNAIASMWWSVYNTVDTTRENKYELTEILFKNYTFRVNGFGASFLMRHKEAMIGVLSFLFDNPVIINNALDERGRYISKYFNRLGAVKQLAFLNRDFFYTKCEHLKSRILSVKSRQQIADESLYNDLV